jgi:GGDEF domain-containing protein
MARRPEEKYKPGELTRVKHNLGQLSPEEAKRMSKILGGEIGIEQTDQKIDESYKEINDQNIKNKKTKWINQPSFTKNIQTEFEIAKSMKYNYFEKIKLYFLASHPDHNIKNSKQIIKAVFDILSTQENYINPNLLENSNYFFYKSIRSFVTSTRSLSKSIDKKYIQREKNPFYWQIVDTICSWDIEGIQEEIFKLKCKPHRVTIESCAVLIKQIYTPIIKLSKLNRKDEIEASIKYIYKLSTSGLFKKDLKIDRLRKSYTSAIGEIHNIFVQIKYRLYPFLLMFVSPKAHDYNTMFKLKGNAILNFLELNIDDLITYKEPESAINVEEPQTEIESMDDRLVEIKRKEDISVYHGMLFLEEMFPGAGWDDLWENADMYPYFKTILDLPGEVALISETDSLQKIVILMALLKDLLYGFSNIEYGFFRDSLGKAVELQDKMEALIKNWYLFIDVLILKNYLGPLNEYCRHIERGNGLSETEYAEKIASNILWIRKSYIYPNISIHLSKIMQPGKKIEVPKLYKAVNELKVILKNMVSEIFSHGDLAMESIRNPDDESWFEIENHISLRLKTMLKEKNTKLNNRVLILYTFQIVMVLDNIINFSGENNKEISKLFRSENSRGFKPIYSINPENTFFRLKNKIIEKFIEPVKETSTNDPITGFLGKEQLSIYLQNYILEYEKTETVFSIIHINIQSFKADSAKEASKLLSDIGKSLLKSIRLIKDIPFRTGNDNIFILLPETTIESALKIAERIQAKNSISTGLFIGLLEYKKGLDTEQIFSIIKNTISKQLPIPGITYYDVEHKKYIQQQV